MQLPTEIFGDVAVIHSPEELALDQAEAFERFVVNAERRRVVLDLDNTEVLDSRGLEALLNAQDQMRGQGGDVKIATTNAVNRKILEVTRLDRALDVFDCVIDAVKSYH